MTTTTIIPQIFTKITDYKTPTTFLTKPQKPTNYFTRNYLCCYHQQGFSTNSNLIFIKSKTGFNEKIVKKNKRVVFVKAGNLGGGGGGGDDGGTRRILGNVALAIGLTYLSLTGQLGWILDTIVNIWLFVVIVPIVGLGALIWWASRDMIEIRCRNCENEFEVFKSMLNDEPQLCPYCNQPFSVVGDQFVRDRSKSSKESTPFDEAFNDLFSRSKQGKASSRAVIDVEAEVKDVE